MSALGGKRTSAKSLPSGSGPELLASLSLIGKAAPSAITVRSIFMRRALLVGGSGLSILLLTAILINEISKATCFTLTAGVICRVETQDKLVALTFDDGPTRQGVEAVLPVLQRYNAKGTFFLIGYESRERPALIRKIAAAGHEVANHSFHHRRMVLHSSRFYEREIRSTDAQLRSAGAPEPKLFRPPYGKKLIGLPLAVERSGKKMIMWDSGDPPDRDPKVYAAKVLDQIRPGSITLIHPMYGSRQTERKALPLILEGLKQRGYRMVTVSELIGLGQKVQGAD
jgi:peptidoglycan-N-acetylglucosamine deacetylase